MWIFCFTFFQNKISHGPLILGTPLKLPVSPYISGPFSNQNILLKTSYKIEKLPQIQNKINKMLIIYNIELEPEKYNESAIAISILVIMNIKILFLFLFTKSTKTKTE